MNIPRITPEVINEYGLVAAPDILSGTPAQNKALFDRLVREKVAVSLNAVLDAWDDYIFCEEYSSTKEYKELNKVTYGGSTYQCLITCKGVVPTNTSNWKLISAKGADGGGSGNMNTTTYDPQNRKRDLFDEVDIARKAGFSGYGVTAGTESELKLSDIRYVPNAGSLIRFRPHVNVNLPSMIDVNNSGKFPLISAIDNYTVISNTGWVCAIFTGTEYRVTSSSELTSCTVRHQVEWITAPTATGTLKYCKINGIVYITAAGVSTTTHFTMPEGYRPCVQIICLGNYSGTSNYPVTIAVTGSITTTTSNSMSYTVSYPADS